MAKRIEGLIAWQKARELTKNIYSATRDEEMSRDYGLKAQIQRAAVSTMTNIAEGFGYSSNKQFQQYLTISRASAIELQSLLYVALDVNYIKEERFEILYNQTEEVIAITSGLKRSLNTTKKS